MDSKNHRLKKFLLGLVRKVVLGAQLDTKEISSAILAIIIGSLVTAGFMLIGWQVQNYVLWVFGPLLGGIIAGLIIKNRPVTSSDFDNWLIKNGSVKSPVSGKIVLVGLLSGLLGAFVFIVGLIIIYPPPIEQRSEWELVRFAASLMSIFAGLFLGSIGGAIGGGIRKIVEGKKRFKN